NRLQFYRPELMAKVELRMKLGAGLRLALERHEFELYYQPIISLADGKPRKIEALIRWQHPQLGLLSPSEFIPIMEDVGLSAAIGEWVINKACREAAAWRHGLGPKLAIAVNVSP